MSGGECDYSFNKNLELLRGSCSESFVCFLKRRPEGGTMIDIPFRRDSFSLLCITCCNEKGMNNDVGMSKVNYNYYYYYYY